MMNYYEINQLWNDLPSEERKRLMPFMITSQILHINQCKDKAIWAHKKYIKELDDWISNLEKELRKINIIQDGSCEEGNGFMAIENKIEFCDAEITKKASELVNDNELGLAEQQSFIYGAIWMRNLISRACV